MKFRSCQINSEQVRLLLFKECDWRGRKVLFDSSAIKKVPANKNDKPCPRHSDEVPCIVEVSNGYSYVYKGPEADASVLGEMIFGAVAINYKSVSLKIHIMDEPRRLMCTKVFCVPNRRMSRVDRKTSDATESNIMLGSHSKLTVPALTEEGVSLSFSIDRGDSGFCGDHSPNSSVASYDYFSMFETWDGSASQEDFSFHSLPGRKLSNSSNGSWQRRTFQNIATRFPLGYTSQMLHVPSASNTSDSQLYCNSSTTGTNDSISSTFSATPKKNKLGLALLITVNDAAQLDVVHKCLEHSGQVQALLYRLRVAALAAGAASATFVSSLHRATEHAATWLSDLIYGPRLQPMWLKLVSDPSNKLAESLIGDLCSVLAVGDTKTTNFFISTLLTHVLTYHLGWVTTVSPYDTVEHKIDRSQATPAYNALWAQLSDLCGGIGFPPRFARTIVAGERNISFINRLLQVLTYFVRCGDVTRTCYPPQNTVSKESKTVIVRNNQKRSTETVNTHSDSDNTLIASDRFKRSSTMASLCMATQGSSGGATLRRNPTVMLKASSDSSLTSNESEPEQKVVFVLGDNEKLIGLKNKSSDGKSVKKSNKIPEDTIVATLDAKEPEDNEKKESERDKKSPSKCCGQTLQHSKPIKHSGFKFEFDKYPQIVTNYMKSKNLEILDRHYIGKPGNLKLDNFQFDPTVVPPIQEERCETCVRCQLMESTLQTPTNASEMEYLNDLPRTSEPQFANAKIVTDTHREMSPKTFVRKTTQNTVIVNLNKENDSTGSNINDIAETFKESKLVPKISIESTEDVPIPKKPISKLKSTKTISDLTLLSENMDIELDNPDVESKIERSEESLGIKPEHSVKEKEELFEVKRVIEFPLSDMCGKERERSGYDRSLLGGVTDHYVPDLVLQGTLSKPTVWEGELRRDLDLTAYLNKSADTPAQAVAIVADTNTWEVSVVGRECGGGGMSSLVGAMLDALPLMRKAKVPAHQCLSFVESKLREFCVLSKTLADMLMSTDFCDISTLTKSLNIDVNDVPLLLAVATTHTPQVATRYGISYR